MAYYVCIYEPVTQVTSKTPESCLMFPYQQAGGKGKARDAAASNLLCYVPC